MKPLNARQVEAHLRANGFVRSASRRLDAELCIIRLCQPELQLDPQSLNARISRLEERVASGNFAPVTAVPAVEQTHTELIEKVPKPAQTEQKAASAPKRETPIGFWPDLVAAVRQELRPPISGFFVATENAPVQGAVEDDQVVLCCSNPFTLEMINRPEILSIVARRASVILGRQVRASVVDAAAKPAQSDGMNRLMQFGREHSDIITVKE